MAPGWLLTHASVRGHSHASSGAPNQDWVETCTSPDGALFSVVVSDGAGSAPRSHEGARLACEHMAPRLLEIGLALKRRSLQRSNLTAILHEHLQQLREKFAALGGAISDFHCTLAMAVLGDSGGFVCQVGDSIALSSRFRAVRDGEVDFFPESETQLFVPERGEYANETHFITEKDWIEHLRVHPLEPNIDSLFVMTDGAMDVALVRGRVFRGFMSNLVGQLLTMPQAKERDRLLAEWLDDPRTRKATGDDKTMFIAMPLANTRYAGQKFVLDADSEARDKASRSGATTIALRRERQADIDEMLRSRVEEGRGRNAAIRQLASALVLVLIVGGGLVALGSWNSARLEFAQGKEVEFSPWVGQAVTLRLVEGDEAVIEKIRVHPEDAIEVRTAGKYCQQKQRLTADAPQCRLYLRPKKMGAETQAKVEVVYRDVHGGSTQRTAKLKVRTVLEE